MFFKPIVLSKKAIKIYKEDGIKRLIQVTSRYFGKRTLFIPKAPPVGFIYKNQIIEFGFRGTYLHLSGPSDRGVAVAPEPSDTVIEAGVYKGQDTAMYAKMADRVIAFEPSPRNYLTAEENLSGFKNVKLVNKGLWDKEDEMEINYGEAAGNDGFLEPDYSKVGTSETVSVNTLKHYVEEMNIDNIDFLKIEAEGAEPEIIKGLGDIRPEKIVINGSDERDGQPTAPKVIDQLQSKGYNLEGVSSGRLLFFSLDPESSDAVISAFD